VVVEQVGGGAAGYLLRRLLTDTSPQAVAALDTEAETPGQAVYAAIEGPDVLGLALLRLNEQTVEVLGTAPGRDDVREALVERAGYDAAAAGVADLHTI
jgi:hypothetical protein